MSDPTFRSFAAPDAAIPAAEVLDAIVADAAPGVNGADRSRPRTIGVMVASVDGHATVEGRSGGLGSPADRLIFRGLRERADALLVGPTTLNRERYSTTLDPDQREARLAAGRSPEPLLATVSRSLAIERDLPLFDEDVLRVVVYTQSDERPDWDRERVDVVQLDDATPATALRDLRGRGIELANCEGGPTLLAGMIRDGLLDELVLTVSPLLVGTDPALGNLLPIVHGSVGDEPRALRLRGVWRSDDMLFLHYHLAAGGS
ncbi:MAG: dihydrofolate reductase family protein [Patulibacter sp.]|nr:dihydrofolate reductase family protein [Patulibacter sp.]